VLNLFGSLFQPQTKKLQKVIASFYLTIMTFLRIARLADSQMQIIKSKLQDINSQF